MAENFSNAKVQVTGNSEVDLLAAVPSSTQRIVLSCLVTNVITSSSAVDVTVKITNGSNTELATIANTIPVPADSAIELIPSKLVLATGDKLRVTSNNGSGNLDVVVSYLDIS